MNACYVLRLFELSQITGNNEVPLLLQKIARDTRLVLVLGSATITKELHRRAPKLWLTWKLKCTMETLSVNKRSVVILNTIEDESDGTVLATMKKKYVFLSATSPKVENIPDKYMGLGKATNDPSLDQPLIFKKTDSIPDHAFNFDYTMMMNDTDVNQHVNHVTYFRLFTDVASMASRKDHFSIFKKDIAFYDVDSLMFLCSRETFMDNLVRISVWEDSNYTRTIVHCVITCESKPVYYADAIYNINNVKAQL